MSTKKWEQPVRPEGGVVVGDDGSEGAAVALRYAAEEAARRGCDLHVLRAWTITTAPRPEGAPLGYAPSMDELEAATTAAARARVEEVLGSDRAPGVALHAPYGPAAQHLIAASASADVVVVGARGLGGFARLVLGSVADQVVRHAECPVVVVRG